MAKKFYASENSLSDEVTKFYAPVNGLSKKVVKAYCSQNGLSKLFFEGSQPFGVTITTRIYDASATVGGVTVTTSIRNYP